MRALKTCALDGRNAGIYNNCAMRQMGKTCEESGISIFEQGKKFNFDRRTDVGRQMGR